MIEALRIAPADPYGYDAARLIAALSTELATMYPEDVSAGAGAFDPSDVSGPDGRFVIAWLGEQPIGCAALRPMSSGIVEFKRLFVVPEFRSQGISRQLLATLESHARELGYAKARAETGLRQPRSLELLGSAGFERIPNYGIYAGNPLSVCFEKSLD